MNDNKLLLSIPEAAEVLGFSRDTMYKLVRDQRVPAICIGPKTIRIPRAALLEWIESATRGGAA